MARVRAVEFDDVFELNDQRTSRAAAVNAAGKFYRSPHDVRASPQRQLHMTPMTPTPSGTEPLWTTSNTAAEYRRKVQQAADERSAVRDSELEAQVSPMKDAQERIGIWERLHALRLPRAPGHALVKVIATQTRLTVGQVHEEQQRRARVPAQPAALPVAHDLGPER
jgi:hypothetical protein